MKVSILSFINDCMEKKRNRKRESERETNTKKRKKSGKRKKVFNEKLELLKDLKRLERNQGPSPETTC